VQCINPCRGFIDLRRGALAEFDDQSVVNQPLQRAIQCCGPQSDLTFCAFQHLLHDAVAVLLATHEGNQYVAPVALEWQERLRSLSWHSGGYISSHIYISQDYFLVTTDHFRLILSVFSLVTHRIE